MDKYEILEIICKTDTSTITKIKQKQSESIFACKEINYGRMNEKEKQQLVTEVNVLRELRHPNIVRYYDRIINKSENSIMIIMEYCSRGDLAKEIEKRKLNNSYFKEKEIWSMWMHIVLSLYELNKANKNNKVIHRGITPDNILIDKNYTLKLGDFGHAKILENNDSFTLAEIKNSKYMAPEQITQSKSSLKSDIWALGCLLYELTCLQPPFNGQNQLSLAMKIKNAKIPKIPGNYSAELTRVISYVLQKNPKGRPSVEELLNIPQISIRLRQKRLKDNQGILNKREEELLKRQLLVKKKEEELKQEKKKMKCLNNLLILKKNELKVIKQSMIKINIKEKQPRHRKIQSLFDIKITKMKDFNSTTPHFIESIKFKNKQMSFQEERPFFKRPLYSKTQIDKENISPASIDLTTQSMSTLLTTRCKIQKSILKKAYIKKILYKNYKLTAKKMKIQKQLTTRSEQISQEFSFEKRRQTCDNIPSSIFLQATEREKNQSFCNTSRNKQINQLKQKFDDKFKRVFNKYRKLKNKSLNVTKNQKILNYTKVIQQKEKNSSNPRFKSVCNNFRKPINYKINNSSLSQQIFQLQGGSKGIV